MLCLPRTLNVCSPETFFWHFQLRRIKSVAYLEDDYMFTLISFLHCLSVGLYAKDPDDKKNIAAERNKLQLFLHISCQVEKLFCLHLHEAKCLLLSEHILLTGNDSESTGGKTRQSMKCYIYSTPKKSREIVDSFCFTFISVFCVCQSNCAVLNSIENKK